ncbi:hypothetical protein [Acidovorax sp. CCYZU-2555]|uniref:hypothetical protein n=1 Tax=Acidovorax sp. CCYZU-2555 TaxID=2835042 RepID=UPI0020C0C747|nr:hypothetical protein [Acidovorax sp. CCYZU-2555]
MSNQTGKRLETRRHYVQGLFIQRYLAQSSSAMAPFSDQMQRNYTEVHCMDGRVINAVKALRCALGPVHRTFRRAGAGRAQTFGRRSYKGLVSMSLQIVKVDDTVPGMWTVGLSLSGNEVGYFLKEYASAPAAEVSDRIAVADAKLRAAGAHCVVQSVRDLPAVLLDIAARMRVGETGVLTI